MANELYCDNFIMSEDGENFEMTQTTKGDPGEGVPTGGTAGQVLKKKSDTDYDTEWADINAGDIGYDDTETYQSGTAGAALNDLSRQISDLTDVVSTTQIINSASGAIASFDDGADNMPIRKLVAQIEPVQDLHGYDNPWPAGGGKNLIDPDLLGARTSGGVTFTRKNNEAIVTLTGTATAAVSYYICPNNTNVTKENCGYILPAGTYTYSLRKADGSALGLNAAIALFYWEGDSDTRQIVQKNNDTITSVTLTSTETLYVTPVIGCNANYSTNFDVYIQLEAGSAMTDWTPYSNICPISGWTGAEIEQRGKNLLDCTETGTQANLTYHVTNVVKAANKITYQANGTWAGFRLYRRLKPGTYTFSADITSSDSGYTAIQVYVGDTKLSGNNPVTFTLSEETIINLRFVGSDTTSSTRSVEFNNIQLELASAKTSFVPYTGNQISVNWEDVAGTVYGGQAEVIGGELTSDFGLISYSNADGFTSHSSGRWYRNGLPDGADYSRRTESISNQAIYDDHYTNNPFFAFGSAGVYINKLTADETIEQFSARLAANPFQICYPINPQTYQLEEQSIDTLYGTNNIWSSTGDTEVTYPCDTRLYIDNKIAEAIAALNS